jgi:polar amino acid transport system substrate-binding protein
MIGNRERHAMDDPIDTGKRDLMKTAVGVGGIALGAGLVMGRAAVQEAQAQLLESGIDPNSVLAKLKKDGVLRVGYAQTPPWFYQDAKTGQLTGIYKDVCETLAHDLEMKVEYAEVSFANATVGLRKGDFDLFGSSLTYTVPRALVVNYVGPLWSKGTLAVTHKDFADRFKTIADFNREDVIFSQNAGSAEESRMQTLFPKAKMTTTTGQLTLAAEPVRAKKAHLFVTGDSDALLLAKRNPGWAVVVDPDHPFDKKPATWAIRYGDPSWKYFLDMWADAMVIGGRVETVYREYMAKMG